VSTVVKRVLVGRPLANADEHRTRLPKRIGLAVFASDAISSTAYATEEILVILLPVAGLAALHMLVPISLVVAVLLLIVITSYRQTIHAYPDGGGAYVVARENLGQRPSLVAAAALLIDYTLTVAVSVSAGVAAVVSAVPAAATHRVGIGAAVIALLVLANLRGARESGTLFAIPTYLYLLALGTLLTVGLWRTSTGALGPIPVDPAELEALTGGSTVGLVGLAGAFVVARAFSSGAVALTGTEAITNGVPAFRAPEARNAGRTLVTMGVILGSAFLGISVLADRLRPLVREDDTVLSQLGGAVFGRASVLYVVLQVTTMLILFLAANTAFADFPRLASIVARDGFLPRQLTHRGDRLVFSNGVVLLGAAAAGLLAAFGGVTSALIPLYAVGVFTGFTLSQLGMVRHHATVQEAGWRRGQLINAVGATATAAVLVVVVVSKFTTGAWIPAVVIPALVWMFQRIHRHYLEVKASLRVPPGYSAVSRPSTTVVLVSRVHRGAIDAIAIAQKLADGPVHVVSVAADEAEEAKLRRQWRATGLELPFEIIVSPVRELRRPLDEHLDGLVASRPGTRLTVVLPEFVVRHGWEHLLHGQTSWLLQAHLRHRPDTVIVTVPVQVEEAHGLVHHRRDRPGRSRRPTTHLASSPAGGPNGDQGEVGHQVTTTP
jgi:amino acid transporter